MPLFLKCVRCFLLRAQVAASVAPFQVAVADLAQYRCQAALTALERLPPAQAASAAALVLMGRAHYEMVQYKAAAAAFQAARQRDQYCLEVCKSLRGGACGVFAMAYEHTMKCDDRDAQRVGGKVVMLSMGCLLLRHGVFACSSWVIEVLQRLVADSEA